MNTLPKLIIVTGPPASGKSTLATWLSKQLKIPVLSKDTVRECLFDHLGWGERLWAQKLGKASIALMLHVAKVQLDSGGSIILDNAFDPTPSTRQFETLHEETKATFVQIVCQAKTETCMKRFKQRAKKGNRHVGHGDTAVITQWQDIPPQFKRFSALPLTGKIITVNTEDFALIDYGKILVEIEE